MAETLYRKWRPRSFAELAGQEHVATTLRNALASGRVSHAYLFAGPRGTGKTSTGRLLAKALNCRNRQDGEACNACDSCRDFLAGRAMDLIEMDAASNRGIEEIRSLRDKVGFAPGAGDYKVYLIDEVHMLTEPAFNALLKTLEEPPPHAIFILATTDAHKVLATIASRCQRFDFRRIPLAAAVKTLSAISDSEGIKTEPAALELLARTSTGSLRDSINLLDQMATSYGNELSLEQVRAGLGLIGDERSGRLARLALNADLAAGLALIASVRDDGLDLRQFQRELVDELRALLLVKSGAPPEEATAEQLSDLKAAVENVPVARVLTALRAFGAADLKQDPNSTLPLDIALAECSLAVSATAATGSPVKEPAQTTITPARREASTRVAGPSEALAPPIGEQARRTSDATPAQIPRSNRPAPLPARAPYVAATPVEPTVAAARRAIRQIYAEARAASAVAGGLINSACDIIEANEDEIVIGFKFPLHAEHAGAKPTIDLLTDITCRVMGRQVRVRCVLDPSVESWQKRETAARSPLVRAAQEMGARVVSKDPPED